MNRKELETFWSETLRSDNPTEEQLDAVAAAVVEIHSSGNSQSREHISNRLKQITDRTGRSFDSETLDISTARLLVADEIGFTSWDELAKAINDSPAQAKPLLFLYAVAAMERGDFSALESMVGGTEKFHGQIVEWYEKGFFADEQETLAEVFSAACMLGHAKTAEYLLDKHVDPYAGMKTGLSGFHYAASSGRLNVIKLLIDRKVPMEVKNMYGGTVLDQAIWSAVNEYSPDHAAIVEALVETGAIVDEGYLEWWNEQNVPDAATKERIAKILKRHEEFYKRVSQAKHEVADAEADGSKRVLADALKQLGNILRRPPFMRDAANDAYARAAEIYSELGMPLEEAWVKRHIGINHEYAERLTEAEKYYDESLGLFRQHASDNDDNYANTVRYPAVIKNRVGKRDESMELWEEAVRRYDKMDQPLGVAEGAAWLTIFAIEKGDLALANEWFAKAAAAAAAANDPDTDTFIAEVKAKIVAAESR